MRRIRYAITHYELYITAFERFKIMAEAFLNLTNEQINTLINNRSLVELEHE